MRAEPLNIEAMTADERQPRSGLTIVLAGYAEWTTRPTLWRPPTDVIESEDMVVVRIEAAGMQGGEFSLSVEPNRLAVRGVRQLGNVPGAFLQMEINTGEFISVVELSDPIDVGQVTAEYRDGFLTIRLPKSRQGL
jgi:HSP20 family molecular chaperone IbpA